MCKNVTIVKNNHQKKDNQPSFHVQKFFVLNLRYESNFLQERKLKVAQTGAFCTNIDMDLSVSFKNEHRREKICLRGF